jgi:hypothetical protein
LIHGGGVQQPTTPKVANLYIIENKCKTLTQVVKEGEKDGKND